MRAWSASGPLLLVGIIENPSPCYIMEHHDPSQDQEAQDEPPEWMQGRITIEHIYIHTHLICLVLLDYYSIFLFPGKNL